ncbi:hypothetical protein BJV77DRAFT_1035451 [Russula vinacea]|nr:hypothetical protein BJV77DRAFT_1035451 [Russula vinacea]
MSAGAQNSTSRSLLTRNKGDRLQVMKEDLETKRLDGLRTAKTDTRHSRHLVLGLALVRKSSLMASLNPQRRGKVVVEKRERGNTKLCRAFELLRGVFKKDRQPCAHILGGRSTGAGPRILFFSRSSVRVSDPRLIDFLAASSQSLTEKLALRFFQVVLLFASASRKRLSPS